MINIFQWNVIIFKVEFTISSLFILTVTVTSKNYFLGDDKKEAIYIFAFVFGYFFTVTHNTLGCLIYFLSPRQSLGLFPTLKLFICHLLISICLHPCLFIQARYCAWGWVIWDDQHSCCLQGAYTLGVSHFSLVEFHSSFYMSFQLFSISKCR